MVDEEVQLDFIAQLQPMWCGPPNRLIGPFKHWQKLSSRPESLNHARPTQNKIERRYLCCCSINMVIVGNWNYRISLTLIKSAFYDMLFPSSPNPDRPSNGFFYFTIDINDLRVQKQLYKYNNQYFFLFFQTLFTDTTTSTF